VYKVDDIKETSVLFVKREEERRRGWPEEPFLKTTKRLGEKNSVHLAS